MQQPIAARLRAALNSPVITPEDPGYDQARQVFYRGFDRHPAAIVQAAGDADVARVVSLARETGVELAVRSGGHSIAGHGVSEGGIVLDLSALDTVDVDPDARTAWTGAGATAGAYTDVVGKYGLATPFGDSGTVGIGGITLGGGMGFLVRRHGLTIDSLLAAEVVTADGRLVRTDARSHPDLFWAIRGGGGNFGVATRFQFRLHEVDRVLGGMLVLPATPEVIVALAAEAQAAPEELSVIAAIMIAPPAPFLPAEAHGRPVVMALMVHAGDPEAGERAVAPLRALATPYADTLAALRYPEMFEETDGPHPTHIVDRSVFLDTVEHATATAILDRLGASTAPMSVLQLRPLGGAMARVPADATAFAHRDRRFTAVAAAAYERAEDAEVHAAWAADLAAEVRSGPGAYTGFLGEEGEDRVREAYPGRTWDRLAAVKAAYDPTNLFRLNQNIPPAPAGASALPRQAIARSA